MPTATARLRLRILNIFEDGTQDQCRIAAGILRAVLNVCSVTRKPATVRPKLRSAT